MVAIELQAPNSLSEVPAAFRHFEVISSRCPANVHAEGYLVVAQLVAVSSLLTQPRLNE
jgi:hypothetical protein